MQVARHFSEILELTKYVLFLLLYFQFSDKVSTATAFSIRTFLNPLYSLRDIYYQLRKSFCLSE